jgi:hypothetical protein
MSFPSQENTGENDDGYYPHQHPQSVGNLLIQDPLLLSMGLHQDLMLSDDVSGFIASLTSKGHLNVPNTFSPDWVLTHGTQVNFYYFAMMVPWLRLLHNIQRNLVRAAIAPRQANFDFGTFGILPQVSHQPYAH